MKKNAIIMTLVLVLVLAMTFSLIGASPRAEEDVTVVNVRTQDGLMMYGWLTHSPVTDHAAPLWILLHQRGQDHTSWEGLIDRLNKRFLNKKAKPINHPHILAVDLRGHGKSTQLGDFSLSYENMRNEHFQQMPNDVAELLRAVFAQSEDIGVELDTANTVLIGASIGANAAIMATKELDSLSLRAVVMLSPGEEYAGMLPLEAMQAYDGDMLVLTTTEDKLAAASADYFEKKIEDVQVIRYTAYAHGVTILTTHPESGDAILEWLLSPERYEAPMQNDPWPVEDDAE